MSTHVMTGTPAKDKEGNRVRAVLRDESEVAHIWAAGCQDHGRFRAIYFIGRTLYSYGSHYVIGRRLDDGRVLLNADSSSMTTNRHRGAADYATSHLTQIRVPDLTGFLRYLDSIESMRRSIAIERKQGADLSNPDSYGARCKLRLQAERRAVREHIKRHADGFSDESAIAALALAGYPAASWPAIKREAERDAAKAKASAAKRKAAAALADAKRFGDMSDSEFADEWPADGGASSSYHAEEQKRFRLRLVRAHKASKAAGYTARTARLWARLKAFREYEAGRPERLRQAGLAKLRDEFAAWRSGGAKPFVYWRTADDYPELASDLAELAGANEAERREEAGIAFSNWQHCGGARPSAESFAEGTPERSAIEASEAAELESAILALESWRDGKGAKPATTLFYQWERQPESLRERVGGNPWEELVLGISKAEAERRLAAKAEAERLRKASEAERAAAWIAGADLGYSARVSDPDGGALLRIEGEGDSAELVTSHGARVPLSHAVKAFRFVKLIRQQGGTWSRNGRTVRVGHYQIDSIDPDGFNAGCHRINWPEIQRVAIIAGVFDCPADDAAAVSKESE